MLKRCLCLLLCLLLPLGAQAELLPSLYAATVSRDARMRVTPEDEGRSLPLVKSGETVLVHRWAEDWCLCSYGGKAGYLPTERLFEYIALGDAPLPLWQQLSGLALITQETTAAVEGYKGNTFRPSDLVSLIDETGRMTMHRSVTSLPEGTFTYTPFPEDPDDAAPGDVLYAATTYYNEDMNDSLGAGRAYNIELAAQRIHGTELAPGETFSFNALCAPYDKSNGYRRARNISMSGVGAGGGVCQVSTTLFNAMLGLDVQLGEFHVHRATGVEYAPLNFDCAVASFRDYTFTNTLTIPLRIEAYPQQGVLTVLFLRAE